VQVKVAVRAPVLRLAVLALADTSEFPDVDATNALLNTSFDDMLGKGVEEVGSTLRPRVVRAGDPFTTRVVAFGDFFREVIAVLFQAVAGVEVGVLSAVRDRREVTDTEVDTRRLVTGGVRSLNLVFPDEM